MALDGEGGCWWGGGVRVRASEEELAKVGRTAELHVRCQR